VFSIMRFAVLKDADYLSEVAAFAAVDALGLFSVAVCSRSD
jgi:hypothetical protein